MIYEGNLHKAMPELPEVQTIVNDLNKVLPGLKIRDVRTDWKKLIRRSGSFQEFKKGILGRKILNLRRRAKFIIISLDKNKTLLIHLRMTGHLLYGEKPEDPYLHLIFDLSNGRKLALSDLRKFAKVMLLDTSELDELKGFQELGPEPLEKTFTLKKFKKIFAAKRGRIKTALMDPTFIAGIGNIYSDEILWEAGVHPLREIQNLNEEELKKIYSAMRKILKKALKLHGDSIADYRRPSGEKGEYQKVQNIYGKEGEKCARKDGGVIEKIKVGGRGTRFCPAHQK